MERETRAQNVHTLAETGPCLGGIAQVEDDVGGATKQASRVSAQPMCKRSRGPSPGPAARDREVSRCAWSLRSGVAVAV